MATVYSSYSGGWTPKGSDVSKKYRTRLDYSVSETNTTYTITARMYVNINSSVNSGFYGYMNLAGVRKPTSGNLTCATVFGSGNNTVACGGTYSQTIDKTTEIQSVAIHGYIRSDKTNGSWGTWQDATTTLTIPPIGYDITFDANGGQNPPTRQLKVHGSELVLTSDIPIKDDYDFAGWNTSADGTGTSYGSGDVMPAEVNEATTLYAQWHLGYIPPSVENIRAYRVSQDATGEDPDVLSNGTRCYADAWVWVETEQTETEIDSIVFVFGDEEVSASVGTVSGVTYGYTPLETAHLPTTESETVTLIITLIDYLGNEYEYVHDTYISSENYVFDAYKGTNDDEEYMSFAIGGKARDFDSPNRSSKGDFDIYMDMSLVLNDCTITDSGTALSVTAGASTDDGKLAQAVIDAFDYATAKDILEV